MTQRHEDTTASAIAHHLGRPIHLALKIAAHCTAEECHAIQEHARGPYPILGISGVVYSVTRRVDGELVARKAAEKDAERMRRVVPDVQSLQRAKPPRRVDGAMTVHRVALDPRSTESQE